MKSSAPETIRAAIAAAIASEHAHALSLLATARDTAVAFDAVLVDELRRQWPTISVATVAIWQDLEDDAEGLFNLGVALWDVDELDAAVRVFSQLAPTDDNARLNLGEAQLYMGLLAEGRATLAGLVGAGGHLGHRAAGLLGKSYLDVDSRTDDEVLDLLTRASNESREFSIELARVLLHRGDVDGAVRILKEQAATGDVRAPILLGNILADHVGDEQAAEAAYRRGIELGDAHSAYNLAVMLEESGRGEEARRWMEYAAEQGDSKAGGEL